MKLHVLFAVMLILTVNQSFADGDAARGKALSQTCVACHNTDGNSTNPVWPKIAGQHAAYIVKQLQNFKRSERNNVQMKGIVANLSPEDMQHLGAYYADQKIKLGIAKAEAIELGERLYRYGDKETGVPACMACHGPDGAGNPGAMYPVLASQHARYTAMQLNMFKTGERANDVNGVMRSIANSMTEEQIEAVSNYIQGLY